MTEFLNDQHGKMIEYDEQLIRQLVEKITIHESKITVEFKSDFEIKNEKDFFIIVEAKRGWILPRDEKTLKRIEKYIETIKILTMPEG